MKKILFVVLALLMAAALFAGCASEKGYDMVSDSADYYAEEAAYEKEMMAESAPQAAVDVAMDDSYNRDGEYAEEEYMDEDSGGSAGLGMDNDSASILEPTVDRKIIFTGFILTVIVMMISIMPGTTAGTIGWCGCGEEVETDCGVFDAGC